MGDMLEMQVVVLHQIRVSNNDPQQLAKWASDLLCKVAPHSRDERHS